MKQAHKKRSPRATANSPPVLPADGQKLLYKSGKFIQCNSINDVQLSLMSHPFVMTKVTKRTTMKPQSSYISISFSHNRIEKNDLVIFDDFGLQPLDNNSRLALLQILEDCYQRKSVIVTSQLPVSKWYDYINEPTLADAIMDRLTANAVRIELKGDSMRRKNQK